MANHFAYVAARRAAQLLTTCAAMVALSATTAHAQNTFELISGSEVSNLPGLRAMTIRDSSLSICYTVFIAQSPTRLLSLAPTLPGDATARSIERARALAEEKDRRLAALEAQIENDLARLVPPLQAEQEYEQARLRLDLEYQRALRREIPESYPWASVLPGVRSGGLEDAANANRRASLDADPTSVMKTLSDQLTLQTELLRLFVEAPRLTSSGPFECPTSRP